MKSDIILRTDVFIVPYSIPEDDPLVFDLFNEPISAAAGAGGPAVSGAGGNLAGRGGGGFYPSGPPR